MALIKVKDLLKHAEENGYGVPAINVFDYNSIKFAVMAAEEASYAFDHPVLSWF